MRFLPSFPLNMDTQEDDISPLPMEDLVDHCDRKPSVFTSATRIQKNNKNDKTTSEGFNALNLKFSMWVFFYMDSTFLMHFSFILHALNNPVFFIL